MVRKQLVLDPNTNTVDNLWAIDQIKRSFSTQANIMQSFTSITHGSNIYFLWKWNRDATLQSLLRDSHNRLPVGPSETFKWFSPHNLLVEFYNLAQAVCFLHNQLSLVVAND